MHVKFSFILFIFLISADSFAQETEEAFDGPSTKKEFALVAYFGGGMNYYSATQGVPAFADIDVKKNAGIGTLRILWHPDHRLRVGIESGFTTFYSYKLSGVNSTTGSLKLNTIPLLLEFSMTVYKNFHFYGGAGTYLLTTRLEYLGEVKSHFFSNGWMLGIAYIYPLNDNLGIAGELKWLNAAETRDASFALQAQFVWRFYKW